MSGGRFHGGQVIDVTRFDLTNEDEVRELAEIFGRHWVQEVMVPLVRAIPREHLGIFLGTMFAAPFGSMNAAVGLENLEAIVEVLLSATRTVDAAKKAGRH